MALSVIPACWQSVNRHFLHFRRLATVMTQLSARAHTKFGFFVFLCARRQNARQLKHT
jgi:hypothetical protein